MKNIYLLMFCMLFCLTGSAQIYVSEPDFVGEVVAISDDGNATPLEKVNAQVKIKDQLMGLEKKLYVNGKTSPVRLKSGKIQLIVRAVDNNTDPMSIIRVFEFSVGKTRKATMEKENELTGALSSNHYKYIGFIGKKYGRLLYVLFSGRSIYCAGQYSDGICGRISDSRRNSGDKADLWYGIFRGSLLCHHGRR